MTDFATPVVQPIASPETAGAILIVEDDPLQRMLLSEIADGLGRRVIQAADAQTAMSILDDPSTPPLALLLLDVELGDRSGMDVLAEVRASEFHATLPVIVLTGHDDIDARVGGLAAGAADFVGKPVSPRELTARVDAQLRSARSWQGEARADRHQRQALADAISQAAVTLSGRPLRDAVEEAIEALPGVRCADILASSPTAATRSRFTSARAAKLLATQSPHELAGQVEAAGSVLHGDADGHLIMVAFNAGGSSPGLLIVEPDPAVRILTRRLIASVSDAAALLGAAVAQALLAGELADGTHERVATVIRTEAFHPVFQPIIDLETGDAIGYEALTRFDGVRPDVMFADAFACGLDTELHEVTTRAIARAAADLPATAYVAVNVSPHILEEPDFADWLPTGRPVVVEVTEHQPVEDYDRLVARVAELGPDVLLAVDDAGAGYASLHHILSLSPAIVKLDRSLVSGIHESPGQEAMVAGLTHFATRLGVRLVAEGVEESDEARMLRDLGVHCGQGWHFGRPTTVEACTAHVAS